MATIDLDDNEDDQPAKTAKTKALLTVTAASAKKLKSWAAYDKARENFAASKRASTDSKNPLKAELRAALLKKQLIPEDANIDFIVTPNGDLAVFAKDKTKRSRGNAISL